LVLAPYVRNRRGAKHSRFLWRLAQAAVCMFEVPNGLAKRCNARCRQRAQSSPDRLGEILSIAVDDGIAVTRPLP